jgi:large subunit ribosomal protein L31
MYFPIEFIEILICKKVLIIMAKDAKDTKATKDTKTTKVTKATKDTKKSVHPELFEITAHCVCGSLVKTRSTIKDIHMTICSQCHPFYTGKQKFVDTAGRIEKFEKKFRKGKKSK